MSPNYQSMHHFRVNNETISKKYVIYKGMQINCITTSIKQTT